MLILTITPPPVVLSNVAQKMFHNSYINFSLLKMCSNNAKSIYFPLEMLFEKYNKNEVILYRNYYQIKITK